MAYGFSESKSKVEVVDKATQDATDASQDERLSAVESKNTEQDTSITALDERMTELENAPTGEIGSTYLSLTGKTFSGSVTLIAGSGNGTNGNGSSTTMYRTALDSSTEAVLRLDTNKMELLYYKLKNCRPTSVTIEDDLSPASNYTLNISSFIRSNINAWLQTLVGKQFFSNSGSEASLKYLSTSHYLYVQIGCGIVGTYKDRYDNETPINTNPSYLYYKGTPRVSVTLNADGTIATVGSLTGNIYWYTGSSAYTYQCTWAEHNITVKAQSYVNLSTGGNTIAFE